MKITLADIANQIDADLVGDPSVIVSGLGSLVTAKPGELSYLSASSVRPFLARTNATAVILGAEDSGACPTHALVVSNPRYAFAIASQMFNSRPSLDPGIHESATVDSTAEMGEFVSIGPSSVVMAGAVVADHVEIGAGAVIGQDSAIGKGSIIMPNATICYGVRVGERCVIHSGAVIGADGFGFEADERGVFQGVAQIGGVTLGDDVNVGACTTIDRGTIDDTIIGNGVKIDNQVQIGHNCHIGAHSLICGCVGIVGSTTIGRHCVIAGGVGIGGDKPIDLCDRVTVSGMTHVSRSIRKPGVYSGGVLHNANWRWKRNALRFSELDGMAKRLAQLEKYAKRDDGN